MGNKSAYYITLFVIVFLCSGFSLFAKDEEYFKKNKEIAEKKLKACETAIFTSNGNIKVIEKIQNDSECIAAENAIRFLRKEESRKRRIEMEEKRKEQLKKREVEQIRLNKEFKTMVNNFTQMTISELENKKKSCSWDNGRFSECNAIDEGRRFAEERYLSEEKVKLKQLTNKEIIFLTYDSKSECPKWKQSQSFYCKAAWAIRSDRIEQLQKLYREDDAQRQGMFEQCSREAKKIYAQKKHFTIDSRLFSEPLACLADLAVRQEKGEPSSFDVR